jgi:hypothetical protein
MGNRTQSAPSPRPARSEKPFRKWATSFPRGRTRDERSGLQDTQNPLSTHRERPRSAFANAGSPDSLYRNHGDDVERVVRSSERLVRERFWLQPDARAVVTGAAQARVP